MVDESKCEIRLTVPDDAVYLTRWLLNPESLLYFPMSDPREVQQAVHIWIDYYKKESVWTALWEGEPCGMAVLNLQPYEKFAHQCILSVIVGEEYRNKGIGTALMAELIKAGKEKFHLEILHLEVYGENPAISLYKRLGFKEFGRQEHFIKESGRGYRSKIYMEKRL